MMYMYDRLHGVLKTFGAVALDFSLMCVTVCFDQIKILIVYKIIWIIRWLV